MQYVDASIIVTRSTHARHMAPVVTASPNESSSSDTNVRRIPMHDKLHYSIMPDATRLVATHQDLEATSSSSSSCEQAHRPAQPILEVHETCICMHYLVAMRGL